VFADFVCWIIGAVAAANIAGIVKGQPCSTALLFVRRVGPFAKANA
jgi:hypothetical protein